MNLDFYKDEYLNIIYGNILLTKSKNMINLYFMYIDYFNLNQNSINYNYINYIALILPIYILLIIIIYFVKIMIFRLIN